MTTGTARMRDNVSKLGRLVIGTHHSRLRRRETVGILAVRVEMVINLFCDSFAYARHSFELAEPGPGNRPGRAEMVQQRLLAACPDARDLVEWRAPEGLGSSGAM